MGSLDDPAMATELFTGLNAALGDPHLDATLGQRLPTTRIIIAFIGMQLVRSFPRTTPGTPDRLNRIDHCLKELGIVHVGSRQSDRKWNALFFNDQVPF